MPPSDPAVDFMIITALEEERDAVLALLPDHCPIDHDGKEPHTYYEAWVRSARSDGTVYRVLVTSLVDMGPLHAAAKAVAVVHRWHPRHVLLVGIAGGVGSAVGLGDVLVASQIADYTVGKQTPGKRTVRWVVFPADAYLLDAATNFPRGWQDLLTRPRPGEGSPLRRIGVILSGGDVIADAHVLQSKQEVWDKLVGVEMEGGGVALALHNTQERPRFLMIRGVSDLADEKKDSAEVSGWRPYACNVAAAYAMGLIRSGFIAPERKDPPPPPPPPLRFPLILLLLVLAGVLIPAGRAWIYSKLNTREPPTDQQLVPRSQTKPPTSDPPSSPGGAAEALPQKSGTGTKSRVLPSPPLEQPECQARDKPQTRGNNLRAYCYCGGKQVGKVSAPFPVGDPDERERVLDLDSWSCPPNASSPP